MLEHEFVKRSGFERSSAIERDFEVLKDESEHNSIWEANFYTARDRTLHSKRRIKLMFSCKH